MTSAFNLKQYEIVAENVIRNAAPARLYEDAIRDEKAAVISSGGASRT